MGKAGLAMRYKVLLRDESEVVNSFFCSVSPKILELWAAVKEVF